MHKNNSYADSVACYDSRPENEVGNLYSSRTDMDPPAQYADMLYKQADLMLQRSQSTPRSSMRPHLFCLSRHLSGVTSRKLNAGYILRN